MANSPIVAGIFLKVTPPNGTSGGSGGTAFTIAGTAVGKPALNNTDAWKTLGCVGPEGFAVDILERTVERRCPRSGGGYTKETISTSADIMIEAKLNDLNSEVLGAIFGAARAVKDTAIVPALTKRIRRWHDITIIDQSGDTILSLQLWGDSYFDKTPFGEKLTEPVFKIEGVYLTEDETTNVMTISTLADLFAA